MKERQISEFQIVTYEKWLRQQEKSLATIKKYCRDVRLFQTYVGEQMVTKNLVIEYKQWLVRDGYAPNSINSMLASVNGLFVCLGWDDCRVKNVRIQREVYCPECRELSKKEYVRLIEVAKRKGNHRMSLLLQTVCSTGIRISELQYITVEALKKGEVRFAGDVNEAFLVYEADKAEKKKK